MSTKTIPITETKHITLGSITRTHLVKALYEDGEKRYESLKPAPVPGYSHELALEKISSYKDQWNIYNQAILNLYPFTILGASWQVGGLDMEEAEYQAEQDSAIVVGRRLGLSTPNSKDIIDMGALAYALIELRAGHEKTEEVLDWLSKEAGLLDNAAVAAERKSPEGDGEQPAPGGSERRDKKPRKGRG